MILIKNKLCLLLILYNWYIVLGFFWGWGVGHAAYGILVPRPGIEPTPPAVEAWNLNHWTAKEVQAYVFSDDCS